VRITVVGAGPAGLYFALLAKRADPTHRVTVLERNPPDATYGWGVVFSEETLSELRDADYPTYLAFDEALVRWPAIDIHYGDRLLRAGGHGFSAIARTRLLAILQGRARELGVELRFEQDIADIDQLPETDLLVGADGVRSVVRAARQPAFGTSVEELSSRYIWFGTDRVFDVFTFIFRPTDHGLFQVHAYPFDGRTSTFIVETTAAAAASAGLDRMSEQESLAFCQALFSDHLGEHRLLGNASQWRTFGTVRNRSWHAGNAVLVGDAAHTAHFSIGSGTKLAIEDSVALAKAFQAHPGDLGAAFADYELERQGAVERFQEAATDSAHYFEGVSRYLGFAPEQFAFNLLTRSGRITHANLELRDPATTNRVDRLLGGEPARITAQRPALTSIRVGGTTLVNRVALAPALPDTAPEGLSGPDHADALVAAAEAGAGLVLAGPVAVSPTGRLTTGSVGCWDERHAEEWARIADRVHAAGSALALRISHAGRRGATLPRDRGLDRPARTGGWTLLAPSAIPYTPWMPTPQPLEGPARSQVCEDFARAAALAAQAGADVLFVDASDGSLLASFYSPLANRRTDDRDCGDFGAAMSFPQEVLAAVQGAWAPARALGVRLVVDDRHPDGLQPDEGVDIARALAPHVALVDVTAGLTIGSEAAAGDYRRLYQVGLADRVRNEAGVATVTSGHITTLDEIDTVVAAGRADVCVLDPRRYR